MDRRRFLTNSAQMGVGLAIGGALLADKTYGPVTATTEKKDSVSLDLAAARDWFAGSLFNLAVDYWGTDWVPSLPYGGGYTRENILPVLKDLQPGFLMIYAKGESGHTSFRSSMHSEHPMLAKDVLPFFREVTRETGTKLFLYWSGLEDKVAGQRYPDWRMLDPEHKPIKTFTWFAPELAPYAMCPQSPFFNEWLSVQLREAFTLSDPDGMWVDGTWLGPCYCFRCTGRYRQETGSKAEVLEGEDWIRYWSKVQYEFRDRWLKLVRSLKPAFLCSFGNITVVKEYLEDRDWCSGDWYSPNNHRLNQSLAMRRYTATGIPFEAWICDTQMCHAVQDLRPRTKSLSRMLQEGAGILANGGQWTYWTFPMPSGALVPSRMRQAKKAAEFARERGAICLHSQSVAWTAVLDSNPNLIWWGNNLWGAGKALIHLHRSPDLIDWSGLRDSMTYELIVVPEQTVLTAETVAKLEAFVRRGGRLVSTGVSITSPELQRLLGVKLVQRGVVGEAHTFLKNGDPVGVYAPWDKLELQGAEELYPAYLSSEYERMKGLPTNWSQAGLVDEVHPEKAGFPAASVRKLGKGVAVHVPTDLFPVYWTFGYLDILAWIREILDYLQPSPLFRTDARSFVEVSLRQKGSALLVHLINGNPGRDLAQVGIPFAGLRQVADYWVDDIPAVGPITCWVRSAQKPTEVSWEPGGHPAEVSWGGGVLKAVLPRLEIHTCLRVKDWLHPV